MQNLYKNITVQRGLVIFTTLLVLLITVELKYFLSGILGAVALYVVTRKFFLFLVEKKNWNKNWATALVLFLIIISFGVPIWIILEILIPQINEQIKNPKEITEKFQPVLTWIQNQELLQRFDFQFDNQQIMTIVNRVMGYVPSTLNWVGQLFANIFTALFILWFMLTGNRKMEQAVWDMLPFSDDSNRFFLKQNFDLIKSNAYGVPILAVSQAVIAIIGYLIFGVENAVFWGLMTGVASIIPVVGTMVVWIPVCIYQMATGDMNNGLFLALYCLILVGGIDNVLRFTILKKMADIHPIITVFGVILGLQLFGVMGLVFGPLLLSLPGIFYAIYKMERGQLPGTELLVENRDAAVEAVTDVEIPKDEKKDNLNIDQENT